MAHRGIGAAVVGRVMALGAELERNPVPGISGSGCRSRDAPREEVTLAATLGARPSVSALLE